MISPRLQRLFDARRSLAQAEADARGSASSGLWVAPAGQGTRPTPESDWVGRSSPVAITGDRSVAMDKPKIVTVFLRPPIPLRQCDWCAYRDGQEERGGYGYGPTEQAAIDDLLENEAS